MIVKKTFSSLLILYLMSLTLLGCTQNESPASNVTETTINTSSAPTPLIEVVISFPDGAPPLNRTRLLQCSVITHERRPAINMGIDVDLPDAFELLSGELSWQAEFVPADSNISVIQANVKAIHTGNWTIDIMVSLNAEENGGYHGGSRPIFVCVLEDSAEWRLSAPYGTPPPLTVEPGGDTPTPPALEPPPRL